MREDSRVNQKNTNNWLKLMNETIHANAAADILRDERTFLQKRIVAEDSWTGSDKNRAQ